MLNPLAAKNQLAPLAWKPYVPPVDQTQYALNFNGVSTTVNCGNDPSLSDLHAGAMTVEMWIRPTNANADYYLATTNNVGWYIQMTSGYLTARIYCATTNASVHSKRYEMTSGVWHHVAMTWDDTWGEDHPRLWIDGVEPLPYTFSTNRSGPITSDSGQAFKIGYISTVFNYNGDIAWVRISDNIRYTTTFTPPAIDDPQSDGNTVELWKMNDGAGNDILASVNPSNDGVASNHRWLVPGWWNLYDVFKFNPQGVWQSIGAVSLAASYNDLSGKGSNLTVGSAPGWSSGNGWDFNGTSHYLLTGVNATENATIICRFSNGATSGIRALMGSNDDGPPQRSLAMWHYADPWGLNGAFRWGDGIAYPSSGTHISGVWAIAKEDGYIDAVNVVNVVGSWVAGDGIEMFLGCRNSNTAATNFFSGNIHAAAVFKNTLTAQEVADVTHQLVLETGGYGLEWTGSQANTPYVHIANADSPAMNIHLGQATWETWIKYSTAGDAFGAFFSQGSGAQTDGPYHFFSYKPNNRLDYNMVYEDGTRKGANSPAGIGPHDNQWHHLAITYNDTGDRRLRWYLDGTLVWTCDAFTKPLKSTGQKYIRFGSVPNAASGPDGIMAWSRYSNVIRYPTNFIPPERLLTPEVDDDTVALWMFNEGSGIHVKCEVNDLNNGWIGHSGGGDPESAWVIV